MHRLIEEICYLIRQDAADIWHNIKDCFEGGDKVAVVETKKDKKEKAVVGPVTMSCEQGAERHGQEARNIARMCLRGKSLAKKHGGASKVPEKEKKTAIFAKKVGKAWAVPVSELDRVFLP